MKTGKEENRPTPDTDANIWASISGCIRGQHGEPIERCYVPAGFAQTLERQRDVARENTKAWHGEYRALNDLHRDLGLKHKEALRQRDEARYQLATATDRAERAEARLREFCRQNPSRWTRLEFMDLRDQLREALERFLEAVPEVPPALIAKAREAIEAAKAHEKEMESKANEGHED